MSDKDIKIEIRFDSNTNELKVIKNGVEQITSSVKTMDKSTKKARTSMSKIKDEAKGLKNSYIKLTAAVASFVAVGATVKQVTSLGFYYNKQLEDATQGLASLTAATSSNISAMGKHLTAQEKLIMAQKDASKTMKMLEAINAETPHTLSQTNEIYKAMYVPMKNVHATTEQMVEITKKLSIATGSAGIEFQSVLAGVDGLATGTVLANSDLGRFLSSIGLTNDELKKTSNVTELLLKKLDGFQSVETYSVVMSNFGNAVDKASGAFTRGIFEDAKITFKELAEEISKNTLEFEYFGMKVSGGLNLVLDSFLEVMNTVQLGYQTFFSWIERKMANFLYKLKDLPKYGDTFKKMAISLNTASNLNADYASITWKDLNKNAKDYTKNLKQVTLSYDDWLKAKVKADRELNKQGDVLTALGGDNALANAKKFIDKTDSLWKAHYTRINDYSSIHKQEREALEKQLTENFRGNSEEKSKILQSFEKQYTDSVLERIREENEEQEKSIELAKKKSQEVALANLKAYGSIADGMNYALENEIKLLNSFEQGQQLTQTAFSSLQSSFDTFFDKQSKNFLDFGKLGESVLEALLKKMLQMQVIDPLAKAGSQAIGSVFDYIGSAVFSGFTTDTTATSSSTNTYTTKAIHARNATSDAMDKETGGHLSGGGSSGKYNSGEYIDGEYIDNGNLGVGNYYDTGSGWHSTLKTAIGNGYYAGSVFERLNNSLGNAREDLNKAMQSLEADRQALKQKTENLQKLVSYSGGVQEYLPDWAKSQQAMQSLVDIDKLKADMKTLDSYDSSTITNILSAPFDTIKSFYNGVVDFISNPSKAFDNIVESVKNIDVMDILNGLGNTVMLGIGAFGGAYIGGAFELGQIGTYITTLVGKYVGAGISKLAGFDDKSKTEQQKVVGDTYKDMSLAMQKQADAIDSATYGMKNTIQLMADRIKQASQSAYSAGDSKDNAKTYYQQLAEINTQKLETYTAHQEDVIRNAQIFYKDLFDVVAPGIKSGARKNTDSYLSYITSSSSVNFEEIYKNMQKEGTSALTKTILDGSLFDTPNFYKAWEEYAKKKDVKVNEALNEAFSTINTTKQDFKKWTLADNSVALAKYNNEIAQKSYESLAKSLGVKFADLTAENFLDKYNEAVANSFDPTVIEKWGNLSKAFQSASEAQTNYTNAVLSTSTSFYNAQIALANAMGIDSAKLQIEAKKSEILAWAKTNSSNTDAQKSAWTLNSVDGWVSAIKDKMNNGTLSSYLSSSTTGKRNELVTKIAELISLQNSLASQSSANTVSYTPTTSSYNSMGTYDYYKNYTSNEKLINEAKRLVGLTSDLTTENLKSRYEFWDGKTGTSEQISKMNDAFSTLENALKGVSLDFTKLNEKLSNLSTSVSDLSSVYDTSKSVIDKIRGTNEKYTANQYSKYLKQAQKYNDLVKTDIYNTDYADKFKDAVSNLSGYVDSYLDEDNFTSKQDWEFRKSVTANQFGDFKQTSSVHEQLKELIDEMKELKDEMKAQGEVQEAIAKLDRRTSNILEQIENEGIKVKLA